MRTKTVALLVVAMGCGLIAMLGVRRALDGRQRAAQEEKVPVLVAVTDIPVGGELTPENVRFRNVAVSLVPQDAVTSEEQYARRAALVPILPNDFITLSKLSEPGERGKSVAISKGMRVVSVKVNDTQTHSNMLAPGDRVDVLVTYSSRGPRGMTTKTKTLLEYVEVFATGNKTVTDANKDVDTQIKTVSLLVTPEQANYIYLAQRKGELSLVWRNIADDEQVQVAAVDERLMEELSGTVDKDASYGYGSPYQTGHSDLEPQPSLTSWLSDQERAQPTPEATPEPETKPETVVVAQAKSTKPTWKMVIYAGEQAQTVELELPEEAPADDQRESGPLPKPVKGKTEPVSAPAFPFESILESFQKLPFGK